MKITSQVNLGHAGCKVLSALMLITLPLFYAAGQTDSAKSGSSKSAAELLPDGPGKDVVVKKCASCHSMQNVIAHRGTADDWAQEISKMVGRGASISDDDAETIVDYLAEHFGPTSPKSGEPSHSEGASKPASSSVSTNKTGDSSTLVHVNNATANQLQSGLALTQDEAEMIVHYREQNGDFKNLQQLLSVLGDDAAAKNKIEQSKIEF